MKRNLFFAVMGFVLIGLSAPVYSQPEPLGAAQEDIWVTYGTVSELSDKSIVIKEFDFETEQEKAVSYTIDSGTEMKNVSQISEIKLGDDVVIEFVEKNDIKLARSITKEKAVAEPNASGEVNANDTGGSVLEE